MTVKCRIGVDEQDPEPALDTLAAGVFAAGADALWVHARKAWLEGLRPKENRDIPPLDYGRVYRLKQKYPDRFIGINGGILTLDEASGHLAHVDGAMLGRAAYHTPGILADADARFFGGPAQPFDAEALIETMADYAERHIAERRTPWPCHAPHGRTVPRPSGRAPLPPNPVHRRHQAGCWPGCARGRPLRPSNSSPAARRPDRRLLFRSAFFR